MRIIIIGCEYVGKSTLAVQISRWMIRNDGAAKRSLARPFRATTP